MKFLYTISALIVASNLNAQSLSPSVIASAGGHSTAGGVTLSYTVGEMAMVETFTAGNNILTQGFHQPEINVTRILEAERTDYGSFVVYPNPATTEVWFGYEFPEEGRVEVTLLNALGQVVQNVFSDNDYQSGKAIHSLNVSLLAAGNYLMQANFAGNSGKQKLIAKKLQLIGN